MIAAILLVAILPSDAEPKPPEPPVPGVTGEVFARAATEHKIAMLDALKWVDPRDQRVVQARDLLKRLDSMYAEDATKIVELTALFWREIRSMKHKARATEILKGV